MALSTGYAVRIYVDGGSDSLLTGIHSQNLPSGTETSRDQTAGVPYPSHISVTAQKPRPRFASYNVAVALGLIASNGLPIASTTNPGLEFYKTLLGTNGQPVSGSNHTKIAVRKGLILPSRLSCGHQGHASIEYNVLPIYDGTNGILTTTASVALPGTWSDTERFGLGQFTVGGVTVDQITNFELDYGIQADTFGGDGEIWDDEVEVSEVKPIVRITGRFVNLFTSSLPHAGLTCTHANTACYLRKRLQTTAGYVADGTAEHIKLTWAGLAVWDEIFEQTGTAHGMGTIRVPLTYDLTNFPVVFDNASAIT